MTPKSITCFPNGTPPTSIKKLNSYYSDVLPFANDALCRSISAFTRLLLDMNHPSSDVWQKFPSAENLELGRCLPISIFNHPIDPIPESALHAQTQTIPTVLRTLFLNHLKKSGFPGSTFLWENPWECTWNQLVATCILQHWRHAHQAGVFRSFYINPNLSSNVVICTGVLHRWFMGRQNGLRLGRFSPGRLNAKKESESKSKLRRQLRTHRHNTLSMLKVSVDEKILFDSIKCSSETEKSSGGTLLRIPIPWRSSEFNLLAQQCDKIYVKKQKSIKGGQFVANYALEVKRSSTSSCLAAGKFRDVQRKLPINCYSQDYLNTLSPSEKLLLNPKPPIDFGQLLSKTLVESKLVLFICSLMWFPSITEQFHILHLPPMVHLA